MQSDREEHADLVALVIGGVRQQHANRVEPGGCAERVAVAHGPEVGDRPAEPCGQRDAESAERVELSVLPLPRLAVDGGEVVAVDGARAGCDGTRRTLRVIAAVAGDAVLGYYAGARLLQQVKLRSHLEQRTGELRVSVQGASVTGVERTVVRFWSTHAGEPNSAHADGFPVEYRSDVDGDRYAIVDAEDYESTGWSIEVGNDDKHFQRVYRTRPIWAYLRRTDRHQFDRDRSWYRSFKGSGWGHVRYSQDVAECPWSTLARIFRAG